MPASSGGMEVGPPKKGGKMVFLLEGEPGSSKMPSFTTGIVLVLEGNSCGCGELNRI